jgi:antiviral helicase SLH1
MLPLGTIRREHEVYEEVIIPPANPPRQCDTEWLIPVSELDPIAQGSFSVCGTMSQLLYL